jgi:hypothetical protein
MTKNTWVRFPDPRLMGLVSRPQVDESGVQTQGYRVA